jgi:hypothetical protein
MGPNSLWISDGAYLSRRLLAYGKQLRIDRH